MLRLHLIFLASLTSLLAFSQSPIGKWKTFDHESGKPKSVVEIYQKNGELHGKIIKLYRAPNEDQNPACKLCPGDKKNQKVIGMEILVGMKKSGNEYEGGTILDPKVGKVYDCKLWLSNGDLHVRGYVGFLYKTQIWKAYKE